MNTYKGDIIYYRVFKYHLEITGNEIPINIRQIYRILGTERKIEKFAQLPVDEYVIQVRLGDILNFDKKAVINEAMKQHYPWGKLIESIKSIGLKVPVVLERFFVKGKERYYAIEGRHRLSACTLIEPFDVDMLIPALILDRDNVYTEFMHTEEKHPYFGAAI